MQLSRSVLWWKNWVCISKLFRRMLCPKIWINLARILFASVTSLAYSWRWAHRLPKIRISAGVSFVGWFRSLIRWWFILMQRNFVPSIPQTAAFSRIWSVILLLPLPTNLMTFLNLFRCSTFNCFALHW